MTPITYHHHQFPRGKNNKSAGAVTLAWTEIPQVELALCQQGIVRIFKLAYAFCSPKDQFVKRTGRIKAAGHLNRPSAIQFGVAFSTGNARLSAIETFNAIVETIYHNGPKTARELRTPLDWAIFPIPLPLSKEVKQEIAFQKAVATSYEKVEQTALEKDLPY